MKRENTKQTWFLCDSCNTYLDEDVNHLVEKFIDENGMHVTKCRTVSRRNMVTPKDLAYIRESLGVSDDVALG